MEKKRTREAHRIPPAGRADETATVDRAMTERSLSLTSVQVKICGLTDVEQALSCVRLGVDAIGLVFFPRSPRHVSDERAREICRELPLGTCTVGVFVNENLETIMRRVEFCGLRGAQLHGDESPELVARLRGEGLVVLKAFFVNGHPSLDLAERYPAAVCLVEAAGGPLPGGNAQTWDWAAAAPLAAARATVLAGGLNAENVREAIASAHPDAVDVSSGVEARPGIKDLRKVERFLAGAKQPDGLAHRCRRVFY
jgi:phosphoribosylanthranilate isomerase